MMVWMAWLAAALVFASFFMKTIVPLRGFSIASNVAFIAYGVIGVSQGLLSVVGPILLLHSLLLPLNLLRLREITQAIASVRRMRSADSANDILMPYMKAMTCPAGTVLFRRGDVADKVYVLRRGAVRIVEFDRTLQTGELFGEVAVFSDDAARTGTAVCEQDCELFCVAGEKLLELFYQDQRFAFQIARRLARYA